MAMFGLGVKLAEVGAHSAQVITHRCMMLATAAARPGGLADPEFSRMVEEKAQAAGESWLRAARHAGRSGGLGAPADALAAATAGVALAESCLVPYRRRVRANARRLGKAR
jgi:hypothetical protein